MNKKEITEALIDSVKRDIKNYWNTEKGLSDCSTAFMFGRITGMSAYFIFSDCKKGEDLIDNFRREVSGEE